MRTVTILFLTICTTTVFAGYDYTITGGYFGSMTFKNHETLLMTGGGGAILTAEGHSILDIQNTAPLDELSGGIWNVHLTDRSQFNMTGGGVNWLKFGNESTAVLRGGRIDNIDSWQSVLIVGKDPITGEFILSRHIEMIVKNHAYNSQTKILNGAWGDDSLFTIQLIDHTQDGYSPAIDNIKFTIIPEPMSLTLLALGGVLVRRKFR